MIIDSLSKNRNVRLEKRGELPCILLPSSASEAWLFCCCEIISCCAAAPAPFLWLRLFELLDAVSIVFLDDLDRTGSGNCCKAGVEGLLARPLLVRVTVVVWMPCIASPLVSGSSLFMVLFLRSPTTIPPIRSGSSLATSSSRCSPFELVADSFIEAFTSVIVFPVTTAAAARSGVPATVPFCFVGAGDAPFSTVVCIEFCLPFAVAGFPPFAGAGEDRPDAFVSGNVLRMGEEASDGDIAIEVTVLFLTRS
jgi:hypothetical protein